MSMESAPHLGANKTERIVESEELRESIERAKELREMLEEFNGKDVVGSSELEKVETIAGELSDLLENISAEVCLKEGLPYHPMDRKVPSR